jgi:hypothetical protein
MIKIDGILLIFTYYLDLIPKDFSGKGVIALLRHEKDDRLAWTMHFWAIFFEPRGKRQINHLMIM